jgi:hypothetical protein
MGTKAIYAGILVCCLALGWQAVEARQRTGEANGHLTPVYQLRIYEIFEHNKDAFHARFRDHAVPIMKKHGFTIRSMWESRLNGRTEFVYLLEWPSEAVMKDRWARFMADPEWARIKKETGAVHGTLVGEIQDRTLKTLDYSPLLPSAITPPRLERPTSASSARSPAVCGLKTGTHGPQSASPAGQTRLQPHKH